MARMRERLRSHTGDTSAIEPGGSAQWLPPTDATCTLGSDEVHLWRAALDVSPAELAALSAVLGEDELARAAQRIFQRDRQHFTAARGVLRVLLGRYLRCDPTSLCFNYGPHGKPGLSQPATAVPLEFNLSHSHGLALIAIARGKCVGVDVERIRAEVRCDALASRSFSAAELRRYEVLDAASRRASFFHIWACKEALLKATGRGLSLAMRDVEVANDVKGAGTITLKDSSGAARTWSWQTVEPADDYAGAVAVEAGPFRLSCWQWPGKPA